MDFIYVIYPDLVTQERVLDVTSVYSALRSASLRTAYDKSKEVLTRDLFMSLEPVAGKVEATTNQKPDLHITLSQPKGAAALNLYKSTEAVAGDVETIKQWKADLSKTCDRPRELLALNAYKSIHTVGEGKKPVIHDPAYSMIKGVTKQVPYSQSNRTIESALPNIIPVSQHGAAISMTRVRPKQVPESHSNRTMASALPNIARVSKHDAVISKIRNTPRKVPHSQSNRTIISANPNIIPVSQREADTSRAYDKPREALVKTLQGNTLLSAIPGGRFESAPGNFPPVISQKPAETLESVKQHTASSKGYTQQQETIALNTYKSMQFISGTIPSVLDDAKIGKAADAPRALPIHKTSREAEAGIVEDRVQLYQVRGDNVQVGCERFL